MRIKKDSLMYRAAVLAASNICLQLMGFAYRIALSRLAGAEGMGVYALSVQVYSILYSVCISGMNVAVTAMSARIYMKRGIEGVGRLAGFAVGVVLAVLVAAGLPIFIFNHEIAAHLLGDVRTARSLTLIPVCIMLTGFENVLKSVFFGMGRVKTPALSELLEQAIRFSLVIILLKTLYNSDHSLTSYLIILGMTLSEFFSVSFLGISLISRRRKEYSRPSHGKIFTGREFCSIAVPSCLTNVTATILSAASTVLLPARLMVAGFSNSEAVGLLGFISGMAEPMMHLPMAFVGAMCTVLMPNISASWDINDLTGIRRRTKKALRYAAFMSLFVVLLIPFAPWLCEVLFKQEITGLFCILLGIKAIINHFLIVSISVLNGVAEQRRVLSNAIAGELVQLGLIWLLTGVPSLNIYGYIAGVIVGDTLRLGLNAYRIRRALKNK